MAGPTGGQRQPFEAARALAQIGECARSKRGGKTIKPGAFDEESPECEAGTHRCWRKMPFEFAFPPRAHHARQRDAHRTDFLAAPTEGRGVWQMARLVDADQAWRQNRAHRPRIDPAVSMAADRMIDRTMIHAGAATDAAEHVLKIS